MSLECDPPHLGDIGDHDPEPELDVDTLDWRYEAWGENQMEGLR